MGHFLAGQLYIKIDDIYDIMRTCLKPYIYNDLAPYDDVKIKTDDTFEDIWSMINHQKPCVYNDLDDIRWLSELGHHMLATHDIEAAAIIYHRNRYICKVWGGLSCSKYLQMCHPF